MIDPTTAQPDRDAAFAAARAAVRRYLRFLGCSLAAADDLAQEALLAGLRHFPAAVPPLPWLLTTAKNGWHQALRAQGRRREVAGLDALHADWLAVAGDDAAAGRLAALRACLRALPPRSQRVLALRYGSTTDRGTIARELGLGEEGVKSLLDRLRRALATCIRRRLHDDPTP